MDDETKNILGELEFYLKTHNGLPIEEEKHPYGEYRHFRVVLDAQRHTVACRDCKKELDPFWYLQLLAKEWSHRKYTDTEAIKAYRKIEEQERNAKARGLIVTRPKSGTGRDCWDAYTSLHGVEPHYLYRRGSHYYASDGIGTELFDYIKMQLSYKQRGLIK